MDLKDFLNLPVEQRRNAHLRRRPRGAYKKRPRLDRRGLIRYLVDHDIHSVRQLRKMAAQTADCPTLASYRKIFGRWENVRRESFPYEHVVRLSGSPSPEYLINTILSFGIQTRDGYLAARRRHPGSIYSINQVRALFGGKWDNLMAAVERTSVTACMEKWLALRRRLGNVTPTAEQVLAAGLSLEPLRSIHPRLADFRDFLERLARVADEKENVQARNFSDTRQAPTNL